MEIFSKNVEGNFSFLHLNIDRLLNKWHYILELRKFDLIFLNETKIDDSVPEKFFENTSFIEIEAIHFELNVNNIHYNFICCYKAPNIDQVETLNIIEEYLFLINLNKDLFIVGDLNMDLFEENIKNSNLIDFMFNNNFNQAVTDPTRICTKYYTSSNQLMVSKTLIDVIIHNNDLIENVYNILCPFSDHMFIIANLKLRSLSKQNSFFIGRNLSTKVIKNITERINQVNFSLIKLEESVDKNWLALRNIILKIINQIAPEKKIYLNKQIDFPWIDVELIESKKNRDKAYKRFIKTNSIDDFNLYKLNKSIFNNSSKNKMIEYFKNKTSNDIKNSKLYWEFYSSYVKLRSNKDNKQLPSTMTHGDIVATNSDEISNLFNIFFTTLSSESTATLNDCESFNDSIFSKQNSIDNCNQFEFKLIDSSKIDKLLENISTSSGPGVSGISSKIIKNSSTILTPILTNLFNKCITTMELPNEWKTAIVSTIYKNKGATDDINNYRGISVIPPIAKFFEKILAKQIIEYFNSHKLLFAGQHGFRTDHSCETALHEIISDMNQILSTRLIGLFLFIDFKRAFDLVDSNILLMKIKHYGFTKKCFKFDNKLL